MQPCWFYFCIASRLLITNTASSTVIARTTAIPAVFPLGKCVLVVTNGGLPNQPGIRTKRRNHCCGKYVPAELPTAVGVMISIAEQTPSAGHSHSLSTLVIISRVNATGA
ncbi:uncharacterized protein LOC118745816 [Rhagoletis pomonella]|uniref:uncharacterized protein LOC118745816 n=1 Tax=Rhagoletis pomonella TaxID=28610 RepID=UPI001783353D|nr:uncharacterized protein LOC118745816 [Rhagoletis pomonella]XP_036335385.1 uncharacterized protein LOC118745816 [Rhagoletis pomonella]